MTEIAGNSVKSNNAGVDSSNFAQLSPSPRLMRAIATASAAHDGHYRKGTRIPYISHPFGVMLLAARATEDEDTLIGALFHDILEDVPEVYSEEEMLADFGEQVVANVRGVTKDKNLSSWQERADAYLDRLATAPEGSVIIAAADKFHNLSATLADFNREGEELWERFNAGGQRQLWWYSSVYNLVAKRMPEMPLLEELGAMVERLRVIVEG